MNGLRMRILKINESVDDVVWICRGRSRSRVAVISDSIYKTDRVWKRCTSGYEYNQLGSKVFTTLSGFLTKQSSHTNESANKTLKG